MYKTYSFKYFYELLAIFALLIILDQATKIFIAKIMLNNKFQSIEVFPFLNITFVRNTGISFGLFSDGGLLNRYFFTSFSMIIGSILLIIALFNKDRLMQISLLFIAGGAIGNAIDRIYFGGVIDFIDFFLYNFHWPAFNLADIFISFGVIILLFENIFGKVKNG
tara:strand:- start:185 stop:679 length:495 start_codon:yes stop_codon:yes gene_type:complete